MTKGALCRWALVLVAASLWATPILAHEVPDDEDDVLELEEVTIEGRRQSLAGEAVTASEGVIGQAELVNRPLLRPGDVLEAIPGLIMTQHSGSGKANQMFLRGFNLDHGTDFATWVDGMPVNLRTHGHGQGYTDINFLIPEIIRTIDYAKGPYHADLGDFSSAGGAFITTFNQLPENQVQLGVGQDGYLRGLLADSTALGSGDILVALDVQAYDGPWSDINEDLEKVNGLLRWSGGGDTSNYRVTAMYYDASWNSADQIPGRAVDEGLIDPLGSIDTTVGGETRRASLSGEYEWIGDNADTTLSAYVIDYHLQLWSNFTYLLNDPENGDQFEQLDDRTLYGGLWRTDWVGGSGSGHIHHRVGAEFRYDDIGEVGLFHTRARERLDTTRLDSVGETSIGAFYEMEWRMNEQWRTVLGLRGDLYWFDVDSDNPANSGDESDGIISPKASLIYAWNEDAEWYVSAGTGFHSNDARGITITIDPVTGEPVEPVNPLVRSKGAEAGMRVQWHETWNSSVALWYLKIDSELLYVGDAGATEASRPSRRYGVEINNYWNLTDVWIFEADFAWTDARFTGNSPEGNEIPNALDTVFSTAITANLPSGWFGQARLRYFGGAPLIEDGSVKSDSSTMVNLAFGWLGESWRVQADIFNLLDSDDHDIDYFYPSRLPGEPAEGIEDIHYHIFEPRQFRVQVSYLF